MTGTLVLFSALFALACCQVYVGPAYQNLSSSQKSYLLGRAIRNNTTPGSFPTIGLLQLFVENMDKSFDTVADDMPRQVLGLQRRPKLIHSVGCIAPAVWVPLNNQPYTGAFKGCSNLLVRFSLAKAPSKGPKGFAPGISIKCLRSGASSANIFAMYSLQGQDSWNFFAHDLTNHVPDISEDADFLLQKLRGKFAEASDWPVMLGLSSFATIDEFGRDEPFPKFPFRLVFHPTTAVHNAFSDEPSDEDFEEVISQTLTTGTVYNVYAQNHPADDQSKYTLIGRIDLTGPTITSQFSDKLLFFQHTRKEDDFAFYPEWIPYAQQIIDTQRSTDYFTFPDLPFN